MAAILPTSAEIKEKKDKAVKEIYGIERPGLLDYYLDSLDMASTGGILTIARKAAKLASFKALKGYFEASAKSKILKEKFKVFSNYLDEVPQKELDTLREIRSETKFAEIDEIMTRKRPDLPPLKAGEGYLGAYSKSKERIIANPSVSTEDIIDSLSHETGHSGYYGGRALRSPETVEKIELLESISEKLRKTNKGLYKEAPEEVYAGYFSDNFPRKGLSLDQAHDISAQKSIDYFSDMLFGERRK